MKIIRIVRIEVLIPVIVGAYINVCAQNHTHPEVENHHPDATPARGYFTYIKRKKRRVIKI